MSSMHMYSDSYQKEAAKTGREVEKGLREVNRAVRVLQAHHNKMKAPKIKANMGAISKEIYSKNPVQQQNLFHDLPTEVQDMIWSYLVHQPDRTALALTCKDNARMHEELKKVYAKIAIKMPRKEHRLAVLLRLTSWMPGDYRLCFTCVRFRWRLSNEEWGGDTALVDDRYVKAGRVHADAMVMGPKCPHCKHLDAVAQIGHKQFVKEYKGTLQKYLGPLN